MKPKDESDLTDKQLSELDKAFKEMEAGEYVTMSEFKKSMGRWLNPAPDVTNIQKENEPLSQDEIKRLEEAVNEADRGETMSFKEFKKNVNEYRANLKSPKGSSRIFRTLYPESSFCTIDTA